MEIMIIIVALIVGILPLKTKKGLKTRSISLMIAGVVILGAICLYANICLNRFSALTAITTQPL